MLVLDEAQNGSSPHAWGTHIRSDALPVLVRFIHTYVGNSPCRVPCPGHATVHPHMRGELSVADLVLSGNSGSSPHTWGTRAPPAVHPRRGRFIPTYVGNSRSDPELRRRPAVHPHIRGELTVPALSTLMGVGSSPHTWGTLGWMGDKVIFRRFIPTYVGNSSISSSPSTTATVHPHIRGELSSSAE